MLRTINKRIMVYPSRICIFGSDSNLVKVINRQIPADELVVHNF